MKEPTVEQIAAIIAECRFEYFNTDVTFDEVLRLAFERYQAQQLTNTVQKVAEYGEKFGSLDQQ